MRIYLETAQNKLLHDDVIAIPTETVYGLAASIFSEKAIQQVFSIKGRPSQNPLIIHVENWEQVQPFLLELPPSAKELAQAFWPGALTLVLPIIQEKIPIKARAHLPTAAFRMPNHPLTLALLKKTGPLVAPSANLSGKPSATTPQHVEQDFGLHFPVLDGGPCQMGLESTILGYSEEQWMIYRLGAIPPNDFSPLLGYTPKQLMQNSAHPLCPGQLYRHYAPQAKLILQRHPQNVPAVLGFSHRSYPGADQHIKWGNNAEEIAQNLYSCLRLLDEKGINQVWVDIDFPAEGLWKTILERLEKAASS